MLLCFVWIVVLLVLIGLWLFVIFGLGLVFWLLLWWLFCLLSDLLLYWVLCCMSVIMWLVLVVF